jgi:hypothetical protein
VGVWPRTGAGRVARLPVKPPRFGVTAWADFGM